MAAKHRGELQDDGVDVKSQMKSKSDLLGVHLFGIHSSGSEYSSTIHSDLKSILFKYIWYLCTTLAAFYRVRPNMYLFYTSACRA